jgi:adenylate cyclase
LQLISRDTSAARWASRYDLRADDMLKFQDDLAQKVVENLSIQVSPAEQQAITGSMTRSPEAYNLYLQARFYANEYKMRSTLESLREGRSLVQRALALDPSFAEAQASLSALYGMEAANFEKDSKEGHHAIREFSGVPPPCSSTGGKPSGRASASICSIA